MQFVPGRLISFWKLCFTLHVVKGNKIRSTVRIHNSHVNNTVRLILTNIRFSDQLKQY